MSRSRSKFCRFQERKIEKERWFYRKLRLPLWLRLLLFHSHNTHTQRQRRRRQQKVEQSFVRTRNWLHLAAAEWQMKSKRRRRRWRKTHRQKRDRSLREAARKRRKKKENREARNELSSSSSKTSLTLSVRRVIIMLANKVRSLFSFEPNQPTNHQQLTYNLILLLFSRPQLTRAHKCKHKNKLEQDRQVARLVAHFSHQPQVRYACNVLVCEHVLRLPAARWRSHWPADGFHVS